MKTFPEYLETDWRDITAIEHRIHVLTQSKAHAHEALHYALEETKKAHTHLTSAQDLCTVIEDLEDQENEHNAHALHESLHQHFALALQHAHTVAQREMGITHESWYLERLLQECTRWNHSSEHEHHEIAEAIRDLVVAIEHVDLHQHGQTTHELRHHVVAIGHHTTHELDQVIHAHTTDPHTDHEHAAEHAIVHHVAGVLQFLSGVALLHQVTGEALDDILHTHAGRLHQFADMLSTEHQHGSHVAHAA